MAVTYAEARAWAVWLQIFTPADLADAMAVDEDSLAGFILGLQFNGSIVDTGDRINGRGPRVGTIYRYVDFVSPADPREHPTRLPEWQIPPCGVDAPRRGMPVRIRTERDQRRSMSTPGARGRIKRREQRYQAMQEAVSKRKAAQQAREREGVTRRSSGKKKALAMARAKAKKREEKHKDSMFTF